MCAGGKDDKMLLQFSFFFFGGWLIGLKPFV